MKHISNVIGGRWLNNRNLVGGRLLFWSMVGCCSVGGRLLFWSVLGCCSGRCLSQPLVDGRCCSGLVVGFFTAIGGWFLRSVVGYFLRKWWVVGVTVVGGWSMLLYYAQCLLGLDKDLMSILDILVTRTSRRVAAAAGAACR